MIRSRLFWLATALAVSAATAMWVVVGTSCPNYPSPTDSLMGHLMPQSTTKIMLALDATAAIRFGVAASKAVPRWRFLAGLVALLTSAGNGGNAGSGGSAGNGG